MHPRASSPSGAERAVQAQEVLQLPARQHPPLEGLGSGQGLLGAHNGRSVTA